MSTILQKPQGQQQGNPAASLSSFVFGNQYLINGRLYVPLSDTKPMISGSFSTPKTNPFGYRSGTLIRRIGVSNDSAGTDTGARIVYINAGATKFFTAQFLPVSTNSSGFSGLDFGPLELVDDGTNSLGLDIRTATGGGTPTFNVSINGWLPV